MTTEPSDKRINADKKRDRGASAISITRFLRVDAVRWAPREATAAILASCRAHDRLRTEIDDLLQATGVEARPQTLRWSHGMKVVGSGIKRASVIAVVIWLTHCAPATPVGTDIDRLRQLHTKVILAHRQSNVELLLEDESEDYVLANRGAVTRPSLGERRERLGSYLRSTTFQEYRDVLEPDVKVSSDGTLGWVIVQVQARGVQATEGGQKEPVEFVSAWIELYEKRGGRWFRVGNVSNFKS